MDMEPPLSDCSRQLLETLGNKGARVLELQRLLTACKSLGPENGGAGEMARAQIVADLLQKVGVEDILHVDCPDDRVPCGYRPNLVARIKGDTQKNLWIFGHLDTVGAGDLSAWHHDPWTVCQDGDFIYGRGVEDNQQAVCSMLILAESLQSAGIVPEIGLGLVFMADEECGSHYGLEHVLSTVPDLFSSDDLYMVPDGGSPDGSEIEIAEKAQLWLKFTVLGAQCHASNPFLGRNAFVASSRLVVLLEEGLRATFSQKNPLFIPPVSTFVPTRHPANVDAVNIMPGREEFFVDCRLLPEVSVESVMERISTITEKASRELAVEISYEIVHCQKSTATPESSPILPSLQKAISAVYRVEPCLVGIGGATVAAFLRQKGLPAVVWSCLENTCHQPNERSSLTATCKDAVVFAHLLFPGLANG